MKGVLRNFAKFTEKHQCQSLFFNKVAGLRKHKHFSQIINDRYFRYFTFLLYYASSLRLLPCLGKVVYLRNTFQ